MYVLENPVLQRELLVNLRMARAFVLLFLYQALLGGVVYFAWPQDAQLDLTAQTRKRPSELVNLFFLGQYVLASMMAPSFAAGSITGEKERKTYEMLLASPLRPAAIVLGKLVASLAHLAILDFRVAADRDALPAAGGRVALRSAGGVSGADPVGHHVRHDQRGLQQLFSAHGASLVVSYLLDPAAGHGGRAICGAILSAARRRSG